MQSSSISEENEIDRVHLTYSDEQLVEKFKAGDRDSFRILVERYKSRVYNIIYGIMGSRDEAEDLSQEVFLNVYRFLHRFKEKSKFYTWLYRIAVNICLSAQKKKNKSSNVLSLTELSETDNTSGKMELADQSFSSQKKLEDMELARKIKSAINSLSEVLKATFALREFEDLSYQELAKIFQCSKGTIKSRLSRAREELRQKLKLYLIEGK